jgi:hypothetical protein
VGRSDGGRRTSTAPAPPARPPRSVAHFRDLGLPPPGSSRWPEAFTIGADTVSPACRGAQKTDRPGGAKAAARDTSPRASGSARSVSGGDLATARPDPAPGSPGREPDGMAWWSGGATHWRAEARGGGGACARWARCRRQSWRGAALWGKRVSPRSGAARLVSPPGRGPRGRHDGGRATSNRESPRIASNTVDAAHIRRAEAKTRLASTSARRGPRSAGTRRSSSPMRVARTSPSVGIVDSGGWRVGRVAERQRGGGHADRLADGPRRRRGRRMPAGATTGAQPHQTSRDKARRQGRRPPAPGGAGAPGASRDEP